MLEYYCDMGADVELMRLINDIIILDKFSFFESLLFQAFLIHYNLITLEKISNYEHMAIDLLLLDYDIEHGNPILYDDFERFKIYKKNL